MSYAVHLSILLLVGAGEPEAGVAPSPGVVAEHADDPAFRIGKLIRCPVCQGMSVAESPSSMAQDMMKKVRALVAEGKSEPEILAFFEERYGEFARLSPRTDGAGLIVWILPPVLAALALFLVFRWVRARRNPAVPPPTKTRAATDTAAVANPSSATPPAAADEDPYLASIRKRVNE